MAAQQIPLSLPMTPSMGAEDFLLTPSNQAAAQMAGQSETLLLLGPKGSGKSHLARIWQEKHGARAFDIKKDDIAVLPATAQLWENADRTAWDESTQKKAFHFLNAAREQKLPLLITATIVPSVWPVTLADLRSRLLAIPAAQLDAPDDALVAGLLLKHFNDRQLRVSEEVLNYIIPRIARDGAVIEEIVKLLDATALASNRAISIPLVKAVLEKPEPQFF